MHRSFLQSCFAELVEIVVVVCLAIACHQTNPETYVKVAVVVVVEEQMRIKTE